MFYGLIGLVLLSGSFWVRPNTKSWSFYSIVIFGFLLAGVIIHSYLLAISALLAALINIYRLRMHIAKNRTLEVIFIDDREDYYLNHFLDYYREDIEKYFPRFDFNIEDEFLIALLFSKMETVGLIIAEIKDVDTLRICVDYMVPKHRNSELAKTFYQCEMRCIDFLGYRNLYIEPQSKAHNNYLERIGFRLVDGKYVNQ
ncbi:MAG: hypothetical protein WCL21_03865 [Mariniphaga sp.]